MKRIVNKKAHWNYDTVEELTAGIVLTGSEVKAIKSGRGELRSAFVSLRGTEATLKGLHIGPYAHAAPGSHPLHQPHRLLLHTRELERLRTKMDNDRLQLIPMSIETRKGGWLKVRVALAKARTKVNKKTVLKERDQKREAQNELANLRRKHA